MTQLRPLLDEDVAADVKDYADGLRLNYTQAANLLIRVGLKQAPRDWIALIAALKPIKGDGTDENHP